MTPSKNVIYEPIPGKSGGQTTLDKKNPSLVLGPERATETLDREGFESLYQTVLHESMHATDSSFKRKWDGFWGALGFSTSNENEISNRASYETVQPQRAPVGEVWNPTDVPVERPRGVNPGELFDETREEGSATD